MSGLKTDMNALPIPRQGLLGIWDLIVGPRMPVSEILLGLIPSLLAAVTVPLYAVINELGWNAVQLIIAAIIAFDLVGGAIINVTQTTKNWHHKPEHGFKYHFLFIAFHLHPAVIAWLYIGGDWAYFLLAYSYLIIAATIILLSPLPLQRAESILLYMGCIVLHNYVLARVPGMEWFLPIYFLKLLVCYLPQEPISLPNR
ncbi:hypothetical protein [Microcoleus sp. FACHB-68]|uniref:hypothetical protein n=1 Tax=Microcoleus sp. FACHB-68 TaxID=2692826 RepID=UPI0016821C5E|nr:hypothetical protein [Microcoleus sp. FACHB-68]MBD1937722.1 hypothetical protein [Microcoleus sp. FACHB-68]